MMKDDYAIVLDFLAHGKAQDRKAEPIAQAIGEKFFNLLEIVLKDGLTIKIGDKLYNEMGYGFVASDFIPLIPKIIYGKK